MMRPAPSWPPTWGSLMAVMGWPSAPAAMPALVWRSVRKGEYGCRGEYVSDGERLGSVLGHVV